MQHLPFEDAFPIGKGGFPLPCWFAGEDMIANGDDQNDHHEVIILYVVVAGCRALRHGPGVFGEVKAPGWEYLSVEMKTGRIQSSMFMTL